MFAARETLKGCALRLSCKIKRGADHGDKLERA